MNHHVPPAFTPRPNVAPTKPSDAFRSVHAEKNVRWYCTFQAHQAEAVIQTLDALALALADKGHTWSPDLRAAYENAISMLTPIAEDPL